MASVTVQPIMGNSMTMRSFLRVLRKRAQRAFNPPARSVGFFVSFPKSGRTWLRVMLDDLDVPFEYRHDGAKHSRPRRFEDLTLCGKHYVKKPVVLMTRDPRDTVISGYFQKNLRRDGYPGSLSDFIRDPLHGVDKVVRFNLAWLEQGSQLPAFLPITYEETSTDARGVLRLITTFVNVDVADADIDNVVGENTFKKMREREAAGDYNRRYSDALTPGDPNNPNSYKVRRGKVGGFVDYLSPTDIAYCEAVLSQFCYFDRVRELMEHNSFRSAADSTPTAKSEQSSPSSKAGVFGPL